MAKKYITNELEIDQESGNGKGFFHYSVNGKTSSTGSFNPDNGNPGLWVEGFDNEAGGIFMNGNTFALWSPGDNNLFKVYDEDGFVQKLTITGNGSIQTNGSITSNSGITAGETLTANSLALDVKQKAYVRAGLVVSPNPSGVAVDNSSVVIGAGNNDIVSGSDHCLTVGNNNQILSDSDRSVSFGNSNTTRSSDNTLVAGQGNALENSSNSHVIGSNNQGGDLYVGHSANVEIGINSSAVIGSDNKALGRIDPGNNTRLNSGLIFIIGHDNDATAANTNSFMFGYNISNLTPGDPENNYHQNDFSIGGDLTMADKTMTLGYRNDASSYPVENNTVGLGATKFVIATGSSTTSNANALLITEGGINKSNTAQVPRIVLPSVVGFNFVNDVSAAAGGIPVGGLYHSSGTLKIRLT
jgi:hypothetical protein